jgi:CMP-N-acetylneuraminic acid synthetase
MPYEAAKISGLFDKIIVSTDSQKIVYTAKEYSPDDWETAEAMYEVAKKRGFL